MSASARREELDVLRGFTLINMAAYHACWDLVYLFGVSMPWYRSAGAFLWQQAICWTFILLSGYCMHLGHRAVKRGITVFGAGLLISAATYIFMPESSFFSVCFRSSAVLCLSRRCSVRCCPGCFCFLPAFPSILFSRKP